MKAAAAERGDWRPGVDSLRCITPELWRRLPEHERAAFLRRDRRWWDPGLLGLDLLSRFHQEYDFSRGYVRLRPAPPAVLPLFGSWWPDGGTAAGRMPGLAEDAVSAVP